MEQSLLFIAAAVYAISFSAEIAKRVRYHRRTDTILLFSEHLGLTLFTIGIIVFACKSYWGIPLQFNKSIGWLFFAWSLAGANLLTFHLYENNSTGLFTKAWVVGAIGILPLIRNQQFVDYFSANLSWLNFHRIVFISGYAFYFLGIPLVLNFLWKDVIRPRFVEAKDGIIERHLYELDRLHHNMILWALPLLSLGLITKILFLLETESLLTPQIIWKTSMEEFLAIVTWFSCALYLHARIFLRWKYNACAFVYLGGLCIVAAAHYSGRLLLQIT